MIEARFNWKSWQIMASVDPIARPHPLVQPLYLRTTPIIYNECSLDATLRWREKALSNARIIDSSRAARVFAISRSETLAAIHPTVVPFISRELARLVPSTRDKFDDFSPSMPRQVAHALHNTLHKFASACFCVFPHYDHLACPVQLLSKQIRH